MTSAIVVENLSKAYQIGQIGTGTISRDIERWFVTRVMGREDPFLKLGEVNDRSTKSESNVVWSLKDVNLEIEQGDAVGIIGRNGAGKSTLLKLLSRVTAPTTGRIKIKGRVASLLEVGTGFHPELTGRENVYLNGSILGMRKREIDRKLDEIVDFSGVERYIDTPVKRYSSGMSVRLAFAVAAHLESEILIVDEVLAVGDAEFQKKCVGKMEEVGRKDGRTVLFVSHNMSMIHALCKSGLLLENGRLQLNSGISECMMAYARQNSSTEVHHVGTSTPLSVFGLKINGSTTPVQTPDRPLEIAVNVRGSKISTPFLFLLIRDAEGRNIVNSEIFKGTVPTGTLSNGKVIRLSLSALWLKPGLYSVYFKFKAATISGTAKCESETIMLEIRGTLGRFDRGILIPEIAWEFGPIQSCKQTLGEKITT